MGCLNMKKRTFLIRRPNGEMIQTDKMTTRELFHYFVRFEKSYYFSSIDFEVFCLGEKYSLKNISKLYWKITGVK